ncbi:NAD-dependent epimerase/dehydratase family protein [Clostridium botulinum]|nr:NAD-dependent epimerase/dehydratase family protein [Clostridium botulinum]
MKNNKNDILYEDLRIIAESDLPFNEFKNSSVLITGATGLIGSQLIKTLLYCNEYHNLNLKVIGLARSKEKVKEIYHNLHNKDQLEFIYSDINEKIYTNIDIDFIIHTASITSSKIMVSNPVETITTAVYGTKNILDLAVSKKSKGVIYISSMEVYGIPDEDLEFVTEKDLGYIDLTSIRSSYSESKRMCELLCLSYFSQYNVPVKIARLAQTFGAGILKSENRVFAQFAKCAINETDIVLHTLGNSEGNYCYTRDAMKALLILIMKGKNGESYNICNEESHIKIVDMAKMVSEKIANGKIKIIFDIPQNSLDYGYAPNVKMYLNSSKMKGLGWIPEVGLEESYRRMIKSMLENNE